MKCPYCNREIDDKYLARYLGKKGGSKSKRGPMIKHPEKLKRRLDKKKMKETVDTILNKD